MCHKNFVFLIFLFYACYLCGNANAFSCSKEEIPCDDGECVSRSRWCDEEEDCKDKSDEAYCDEKSWLNNDPNNCRKTHFLCKSGVCVPKVAECDNYDDCEDGSDEKYCNSSASESSGKTTERIETAIDKELDIITTTTPPPLPAALPLSSNEVDTNVAQVHPIVKKYFSSNQAIDRAIQWLFSVRQPNYGWGDDTARALIALGLVKPNLFKDTNKDSDLMKKQLQIQIAIDLLRNSTHAVPKERLALYVNALMATCQDPRNFHAMDLVSQLRARTSSGYSERNRDIVNPFVLLTLCLVGEATPSDAHRLLQTITSQGNDLQTQDMQVMSTLAFQCINDNHTFARPYADHLNRAFHQILRRRVDSNGSFGNVYSTALAVQALFKHSSSIVDQSLKYLESHQLEDGSFGDFLSTYYILPTLARRSLIHLKSMPCHPDPRGPDGMIPIEALLEYQGPRYHVKFSLFYGKPTVLSYSILLLVPHNTTFFNIMRLAQHLDEKFRFSYEAEKGRVSVYSIGGVPNDAERGIYWHLYASLNAAPTAHFQRHRNTANENALLGQSLKPYVHGVQTLVPKENDHVAFWFKSIHR